MHPSSRDTSEDYSVLIRSSHAWSHDFMQYSKEGPRVVMERVKPQRPPALNLDISRLRRASFDDYSRLQPKLTRSPRLVQSAIQPRLPQSARKCAKLSPRARSARMVIHTENQDRPLSAWVIKRNPHSLRPPSRPSHPNPAQDRPATSLPIQRPLTGVRASDLSSASLTHRFHKPFSASSIDGPTHRRSRELESPRTFEKVSEPGSPTFSRPQSPRSLLSSPAERKMDAEMWGIRDPGSVHLGKPLSKREKFTRDYVWVAESNAIMSRTGNVVIPRSKKFEAKQMRLHDASHRHAELERMQADMDARLLMRRKKLEKEKENRKEPDDSRSYGALYTSFSKGRQAYYTAFGGRIDAPSRVAFPQQAAAGARKYRDYLEEGRLEEANRKKERKEERRREYEALLETQRLREAEIARIEEEKLAVIRRQEEQMAAMKREAAQRADARQQAANVLMAERKEQEKVAREAQEAALAEIEAKVKAKEALARRKEKLMQSIDN